MLGKRLAFVDDLVINGLIESHELRTIDAAFAHGSHRGVEGRPRNGEDAMELVAVVGEMNCLASTVSCYGKWEKDEAVLHSWCREAAHLVPDSGAKKVLLRHIGFQFFLHQYRYAHGLLESSILRSLPGRARIGASGYLLLCGRSGLIIV